MRKASRILSVVVVAACAAAVAGAVLAQDASRRAEDPSRVDITGLYRCEGAGGAGACFVVKRGDTYELRWTAAAEARHPSQQGVGIRDGDVLAVSWKDNERTGVSFYRITQGPRLVGKLTAIGGEGEVRTETLTFQKPLAEVTPPREWQIGETALANWDGDEYWYTATIAKIENGRYFICFDDEGWFWYGPERVREDDIKPGDHVFAKLTKRPDYRPATVTDRKDRMIKVRFDDGNEVTTTIHFIRVLR